MNASVMRINDFISDKRTLIIPVYQRNYNWKTANCEQLFDDVELIASANKNEEHFIGTFVFQKTSSAGIFDEFIIIDGQQRITSTILLAKAIGDLSDDDNLRDDIKSIFIKHSHGELKNQCKLCPNEYDRVTFEKLMKEDFNENDFTIAEKNSALYKNYLTFCEKITASKCSPQQLHEAIYHLKIVCISLDHENPQEIFESLNSTGLNLSKADLIRNFLLMPLNYSEQEELYKNYWLEIDKRLHSTEDVERFLVQYLVIKRKTTNTINTHKINQRVLYEEFKRILQENFR